MDRREFLTTTATGAAGMGSVPWLGGTGAMEGPAGGGAPPRTIVIAGGGFGAPFIRYVAALTGKERPRLCYLPTAAADNANGIVRWYRTCAELPVVPLVQETFISSYSMARSWEEALLSADGIVVSGGNTLNQQAIWSAQGIDVVLREAWERGIVLGGASAGSLCWFEEGTTDSRPRELTIVRCLGFLRGSHSPHYDGEAQRRPAYHALIASGALKPGWACDNDAGIHFQDNRVVRVLATREGARVYRVGLSGGQVVEEVLEPELIA